MLRRSATTFKERYLRGECSISVINDWADAWRKAGLDHRTLPAVLGLSEDEYRLWAVVGDDALAERLSGSVTAPYVALHMDWDELGNQLQDLIHSLLGTEYDISIKREDYYYWNLKLTIPYDVDEDFNRPLAKLKRAVKIANTRNQGKTKSEAIPAIAVTFREDTKSFNKANDVFNEDTFP